MLVRRLASNYKQLFAAQKYAVPALCNNQARMFFAKTSEAEKHNALLEEIDGNTNAIPCESTL